MYGVQHTRRSFLQQWWWDGRGLRLEKPGTAALLPPGFWPDGACLGARDEDPVDLEQEPHGVCATAGGSVREERSEAQNRAVRQCTEYNSRAACLARLG